MDNTKMPQLISKHKTPKVLWYQDDRNVTIRIMLCDVQDFFLKISQETERKTHFRFRTVVNSGTYTLCFQLFGGVCPEKIWHVNLTREIKVVMPKTLKFKDWLRLTRDKDYNKNLIVYDPDHIAKQEFISSYLHQIVKRSKEETVLNYDPSYSDMEDSDDERWVQGYD